jgi:hypothetical protein
MLQCLLVIFPREGQWECLVLEQIDDAVMVTVTEWMMVVVVVEPEVEVFQVAMAEV